MKKTVYVIAFDPLPPNGVGGHDWFWTFEDMLSYLKDTVLREKGCVEEFVHILFPHQTELSDREAITEEIEQLLWKAPDIRPALAPLLFEEA